jgi:hypothetical protein
MVTLQISEVGAKEESHNAEVLKFDLVTEIAINFMPNCIQYYSLKAKSVCRLNYLESAVWFSTQQN